LLGCDSVRKGVLETVRNALKGRTVVLMHPDLQPQNVLARPDGGLSVIDNELLAPGAMPFMDTVNTFHILSKDLAARFLDCYLETTQLHQSWENDREALVAFWLARKIGAAFVAGRIGKGQDFAKAYLNGEAALPHRL